jgi:hypothetical protein
MLPKSARNRPGDLRSGTRGIIVHWPGPYLHRAGGILNWWAKGERDGAAHDIIDQDGTVVHALPPEEVGWHLGARKYTRFKALLVGDDNPNSWFYGMETCVLNLQGDMSGATWDATVKRCVEMCALFDLQHWEVYTHQQIVGDVTHWGKYHCHELFYTHPEELERLRYEVSLG